MPKVKYVTGATESAEITALETQNRRIAYEAACEGIVLLKNEDSALPIKPGKLALFGAGASKTVKGGTGSGEVNERHTVTILEGLENAGFEITTKAWIADFEAELQRENDAYAERMRKTSIFKFKDVINIMNDPMMLPYGRMISDEDIAESGCDTAVYVVARQAGEGSDKKLDKGEFDLSSIEKANLKKLSASYKTTVLVINSGAQMDLSILDEVGISAVVYFCQQGEEGGTALADILTGKVCPSGRLTDTWVKTYADIPFGEEYSYLSGDTTKEYYKEGIYVGYRYFDSFGVKPRFPFGFGLSYTTFHWKPGETRVSGTTLLLPVAVTNVGAVAGKEVVQLYVSAPVGQLKKEYQRLIAFGKTGLLQPGESEELTLAVSFTDCSSYDEAARAYVLEEGDYVFRLGTSSDSTNPIAAVTLGETVLVRKVRSVCPPERPVQALTPDAYPVEVLENIPRIILDASAFSTEIVNYSDPTMPSDPETDAVIARLADTDMAELCVGQGMGGMMKAQKIASLGVIGKTTDGLSSKGLLGVNLSDGPAGVRILKIGAVRENGKLKMGEFIMSFMDFFPEFLQKGIRVDPKKDTPLYQFCTAFPVGTSLAQSWNTALCEAVGSAIGEEMDRYLVTYWLAPAMNIHRNPLCGRNFEYYSEDPLLSGMIAAGIVRGVQKKPGRYATIKHFAANNQEDNRNRSDSIMDERTLREIYLKGFEICVREAKPAAVMSSYNKINGVYTSNCRDILTLVLRNEWGFDGLVMSDWYATGKGLARPELAIAAGNDLIMPGVGTDKKTILKGLKKGTVAEKDLKLSTARIVRQLVHSNVAARYSSDDFE